MEPRNEVLFDMESIITRMKSFESPLYTYKGASSSPLAEFKRSAVLVPVFLQDDVPHILLTKRSTELRSHAGEVAFPGGKEDEEDTSEIDTCLRESQEEIGLHPSDVRIVSRLPPRLTRNRVAIYPVLGIIPADFVPQPNEAEVDSVFSLPLSRFLRDERRDSGTFPLGKGRTGIYHIFKDIVNGRTYRTWGLTANVVVEVAVAMLQRKPDFMFDIDVQISPEAPFAAQLSYLRLSHGFPGSHI